MNGKRLKMIENIVPRPLPDLTSTEYAEESTFEASMMS